MNKDDFRQTIRIGRNITSFFNLPCIFSCHKGSDMKPVFLLNDWDDSGNYIEARIGDWLCEDHEGKWSVLSNDDYKKLEHEGNKQPTLRYTRGKAAVRARHGT